jgi:uncharacterized protein YggU (UPF0235/DUF167 family)
VVFYRYDLSDPIWVVQSLLFDPAVSGIAFDPVQPHTLCYCLSFRISVQVKTQARKKNRQNLTAGISNLGASGTRGRKGNQALVDLLAKYFSVPKSSVKLLRGQSSRKKLFEIG